MSKTLETMTPELRSFVEEWKAKPGNLIMVLHRVQQTYGYIPREIAIEIGQILDVPLAKIYGVITFYNFFRLQKAGKYNVQVCLGTACYLRGGDDIIKEFERQLGVGLNSSASSAWASTPRPTTGCSPSRRCAASAAAASRRWRSSTARCTASSRRATSRESSSSTANAAEAELKKKRRKHYG